MRSKTEHRGAKLKAIYPSHFPWKDYRRYTYPLGLDLGPLTFLSGHTASRHDPVTDKIVSTGDLKAQAATAIEKIRVILEAAGYTPEDVVSLIQYVPPAAFNDLTEIDALIHQSGMGQAQRHVVPVTRLLRRDALVELEVIAARRDDRVFQPNAVRLLSAHDSIFLFGEIHQAAPGATLEASLAVQVSRMDATLRQVGADWNEVARCRLVVASERVAELDAAARHLAQLVPQLPTIPVIGVAALPPGVGRAQFSVELAAGQPGNTGPTKVGGGLVRRAGPFLVATGLRADQGNGGITQQAERIYTDMVPRLLEAAGIGMDAIVQTVEWLTADALPDYKNTGPIRRNALREPFPVSSGLVCSALPEGAKLAVDLLAIERSSALVPSSR